MSELVRPQGTSNTVTKYIDHLEAQLATATEAHQSCRDGWNKADGYCHELERRLAAAERARDNYQTANHAVVEAVREGVWG